MIQISVLFSLFHGDRASDIHWMIGLNHFCLSMPTPRTLSRPTIDSGISQATGAVHAIFPCRKGLPAVRPEARLILPVAGSSHSAFSVPEEALVLTVTV
jgi:hypothetical protein